MRWLRERRYLVAALAMVLLASAGVGTAYSLTSSSENYQVTESDFGSASLLENCSGSYCTQVTLGDVASGESASANYNATFGSLAGQEEPLLEVIVDPGASSLGVLTTETTATKTVGLKVRNYMSNGYTVQVFGDSPRYGGHTLSTPSTPTPSQPGTEQFALNLVRNTAPELGENPLQLPTADFSFGAVVPGYDTPNLFKYSSGDVVARSLSESGRTDYTISMIVNIANSTPAGNYTSEFTAVVVPVF